ncbi:hypothetical protein BD310DRAFT_1006116, partial [Dichomitus squalens]
MTSSTATTRGWACSPELAQILQRMVEIGLRRKWAEFEGTPLPLPRIELTKSLATSPTPTSPSESANDPQDST